MLAARGPDDLAKSALCLDIGVHNGAVPAVNEFEATPLPGYHNYSFSSSVNHRFTTLRMAQGKWLWVGPL